MQRLIEWSTRVVQSVVDSVMSATGAAVSWLNTPAYWLGVPPEILAAVVLCIGLLAAWRAMGGIR